MALRIEIDKSYHKGLYRLRIGDITGSTERCNITCKELMKSIVDEIKMM